MKAYMDSKKAGEMLKRRYFIALTIIAFLVFFSQIMIQYAISKQQDDSRIVNISGRQRMLSQRINKDAFGLYISSDADEQSRYLEELNQSLALWQKSHEGLKNGDAELGLPGENSEIIVEMYKSIEDEYQSIVTASLEIEKIASEPNYNRESVREPLQVIQENEKGFLKVMDQIVFQYDSESKEKIHYIKTTEIIVLIITLFTLMMEVLFIFRPARKQIEKSLEATEISRDNMEKLFEIAPTAMMLIDEVDYRVLKSNHLAKQIFNASEEELSQKKIDQLFYLKEEELNEILNKFKAGTTIENFEIVINIKKDKPFTMLLSSNFINYGGNSTILLGLADITTLKAAEEILKRYATIDEMTGLLNKRSGMLILSNLYDYACKTNEDLCICFIDIDSLKMVNDLYGHEEGDFYIKVITNEIVKALRQDDTVFRYGGDEIIALLTNCNSKQAKMIFSKLQEKMVCISNELKKPYDFKFSFGIASLKENPQTTPEALLNLADKEMYKDKQHNRMD